MKNPSEAFMKALNKHMNSLPEGKEDINTILHEFVEKYNQALDLRGPLTEKTARTSDDFLELAENAPSKAKTIKYLKRACELDDGNVDAELQLERADELTFRQHPALDQDGAEPAVLLLLECETAPKLFLGDSARFDEQLADSLMSHGGVSLLSG